MTRSKLLAAASIGALTGMSLLLAPAAAAQSAPSQGQDSVGADIVVTAQKREQNLQDVPATVSVLSEATLTNQKVQRFEDIAAVTPGLSIASAGAGRNVLTIRGVTSGASQFTNSVGVYLDDIPIGSSNASNNGSSQTGDFDTFDLARVEVLQGPQGTLYGTNTLGGLIHYVANPPSTDAFSAKVEAGGVAVAHGGVGSSVKGVVNIPLSDETALRISGYRRVDPGYIDNLGTYTARDENTDVFEGGRASLLTHIGDRLTVELTGYYQHLKSGGANTEDVDPTTLQPAFGEYVREHSYPETYDSKYALGSLSLGYDVGFATLTSITSYSDFKNDEVYDFTPYYGAAYAGLFGRTAATFATPGFTQAQTRKTTEELRLASKPGGKLTWQLGGFYDYEASRFTYKLLPYSSDLTQLSSTVLRGVDNPSTYRDLAAFANATYVFSPAFDLQLGVRFNNNRQTFDPLSYGTQRATTVSSVGESDENAFTFLVSPSWHVTKDVMLYVRIAKGYRAGGPNALVDGAPADIPREFKSDNLITYEGGAKTTLFDRKVTLDASVYHIDWNNIQLSTTYDGVGIAGNGGKAKVDGFQATASYSPTKALTFSGNASFNNARLAADAPDVSGLKGDRLPTVPRWATSASVELREPLGGDVTGSIGATYRYSGDRYSDYSQAGRVLLPAYSMADFHLGLDYGRYSLNLVVRNAFDAHAFTNIEVVTTYANAYLVQPRTIGLYGTVKF